MSLKHRKKELIDDNASVVKLATALGLEDTGANGGHGPISLCLERVERRDLIRKWTLHCKTLTGRTYDVETSNPQVL